MRSNQAAYLACSAGSLTVTCNLMVYPEAQPHDPPVQIADDLFVVYGSMKMQPLVRITRNMTIVRSNDELTLISPVRMDEAGLEALDALGRVRHVIRLGPMHGLDDPFYLDRYDADFWSFEDGETYPTRPGTKPLTEGMDLPFPNARLFVFNHLKQTEGAILLERDPGILLTVDAVQTYSTPPHMPHTSVLANLLLPLLGFPRKTIIGPVWIKLLAESKEAIQPEFERLLELPFDRMIAAHGTYLASGAHEEVSAAFRKMFK